MQCWFGERLVIERDGDTVWMERRPGIAYRSTDKSPGSAHDPAETGPPEGDGCWQHHPGRQTRMRCCRWCVARSVASADQHIP
ncbi:hypothetical protein [Phaffia rhodozyma]|uniref:Uncharacterized protein n=1 Tax=Phaffia rhodozyma TaxID=264483 RepID=A0A0F7SI12_PHARH|nr:hypothetical protein [Phaffia rhodozyma]